MYIFITFVVNGLIDFTGCYTKEYWIKFLDVIEGYIYDLNSSIIYWQSSVSYVN